MNKDQVIRRKDNHEIVKTIHYAISSNFIVFDKALGCQILYSTDLWELVPDEVTMYDITKTYNVAKLLPADIEAKLAKYWMMPPDVDTIEAHYGKLVINFKHDNPPPLPQVVDRVSFHQVIKKEDMP